MQTPPERKRLVIGIAGRIGAGKTSAGHYLSSRHGFQYLRYSQVLEEWKGLGKPGHLQEAGLAVMEGGLQPELNRRLIEQIRPDRDVAVDGLRHPLDYESLLSSLGSSFHLLYIDSPQEQRWERKKGKEKYQSLESFKGADSHPVEQRTDLLRDKAELVLRNDGAPKDLHAALDGAVEEFRKAVQG